MRVHVWFLIGLVVGCGGDDASAPPPAALHVARTIDAAAAAIRVPDAAPPPPPEAPPLPEVIGMDEGDPAKVLAFYADQAAAAFPDAPPTPVTLTFSMKARRNPPLVDLEPVLRPKFRDAGLDDQGAAPVAKIEVACRERPGATYQGYQLGKEIRETWTRVSCTMTVTPDHGKRSSFAIDASAPAQVYGDIDDASRKQFLESAGVACLPEVAAVVLGHARRAPVLATLAIGLAREQSAAPLRGLLAPYADKLPDPLRAAVLVGQRKFGDVAKLGDAAVPALWELLTSDWGTAETAAWMDFDTPVQSIVSERLPAVQALAKIGGPRAAVLAGLVANKLPPQGPDDEYGLIMTSSGFGGDLLTSSTMHPGPEEGRQLVLLLQTMLASNPDGAGDVLAKFANDQRKAVRKLAGGGDPFHHR